MAWLGKVSLGNFPDLAGAVTKLSESVKNIEKNFDSALGLEEKPDSGDSSGLWPSSSDQKTLFDPLMAFMGQKSSESDEGSSEKEEQPHQLSLSEKLTDGSDKGSFMSAEKQVSSERESGTLALQEGDGGSQIAESSPNEVGESDETDPHDSPLSVAEVPATIKSSENIDPSVSLQAYDHEREESQVGETTLIHTTESGEVGKVDVVTDESSASEESQSAEHEVVHLPDENIRRHGASLGSCQINVEPEALDVQVNPIADDGNNVQSTIGPLSVHDSEQVTDKISDSIHTGDNFLESVKVDISGNSEEPATSSAIGTFNVEVLENSKEPNTSIAIGAPDILESSERTSLKEEMKLMEAALQGAARQAQAKADEIAKLMTENEQLKSVVEDLKKKSGESEIDALREEFHQRVASLERKLYALTKERDTLRREQSRKSDAAALLKEKDEIINQVMAEGEELSRKQAAQESQMRKLRAQIRELEEEKQRLNSKIQVEETKVESTKRDKAATEKLLQETIEKSQAELAAQKEFYTSALNAAKEAEALAEACANNEVRSELEGQLKEAGEREATLVQTLEELRQSLTRTEQQAAFREDMLQRDIDDLQKRYQASERRCEELISQVPESTRPLLRQIEAMQETTARKAEAWAGVERALNSRLQDAEAKAAASEERERSMNERLSQTLSRMAVLEAQISCLRAEQTQLSRLVEKERQRASESRQEYLAAKEAAATHEGRAKQLEEELKQLRSKHKNELQEEIERRGVVEQELERERTTRIELERAASRENSVVQAIKTSNTAVENGNYLVRKPSSSGSLSSIEESHFLQASLDSSDSGPFLERRFSGEVTMAPYFLKSMTPSTFEATLRQKDGELASYMSRLTSLESIRDSLAEELVKMTAQCEKVRSEAALVPGIQAELEALRRRHTAALELMGERDEELEELRADIVDLKEMYREQVDLLVNQIQRSSTAVGAT